MKPETVRLLNQHRRRVDGLFDETPTDFVNWVDTIDGQRICERWGVDLVSAVIAAAAARTEADPEDVRRAYFVNAELIDDRLGRRTFDLQPSDAALMVQLASHPNCSYYEVRVALRFAEQVLQGHPNHPQVMDALLQLRAHLSSNPLHESGIFIAKVSPWLNRLLAEQTPAGLLDLSFIEQRCAWGKVAALAFSHHAESEPDAGAFGLHLCSPRGTRASNTWWSTTQEAMRSAWSRDLVAELSRYLVTADLTPRDDERDGLDAPEEQLVVLMNEPLARGTLWAESYATDDDAPSRIGRVVDRAAEPFRGWTGVTPRCSKVALAGISALANSEHRDASTELERLFDSVALASLIRPIGKALALPEPTIKDRIRRK